jgi:hypothetical protein
MAIKVEFMGQKITPASGETIEINYPLRGRGKFIYASPLNHTHLKLAKKLSSRGCRVIIAVFAPTSQSRKSAISTQLPKWFASNMMVSILVHGGISDKCKFEESYSNSLANW